MSCTPEHMIQSCDTCQQIPYLDSYQLTVTWISELLLSVLKLFSR